MNQALYLLWILLIITTYKEEIIEVPKHRLITKKTLSNFTTKRQKKGGKEGKRKKRIRKGDKAEAEKSTFLSPYNRVQLTLSIDLSLQTTWEDSLWRLLLLNRLGVYPGSCFYY